MNDYPENIAPDWYARAFDSLYLILYAHRTVEAARPEAEFAAAELGLGGTERVLDLCCGNGRHMSHLRNWCGSVTGLDYSEALLRLAHDSVGRDCALVRADMRAIPFREAFDAVTNFFTSFGYFVDPNDNLQVVCGVAAALKPGGRFFIDYVNRDSAIAHLMPESVRTQGAYEMRDRRWIDAERNRINKHTTVLYNGVTIREVEESVQLYSPCEFEGLLHAGGLRVEALYGDYTGAGLDSEAPRMIATGTRE
ncbi:MAG TPA: class I SAM-dependent methyltransferase [Candidatus Hydrogenedentes bacterium]|nr:class I SAM-dependent methyltransferase [Candidatus Hydrogenedentota bacterium]HPV38884.1 class I SAM-dependent methyltransferase [Candidatus Hydrogenedentota bacterium]HQK74602.1 class I SAM-dependent methyltransferase [Candidatus Hydrogenedentota bacterium]